VDRGAQSTREAAVVLAFGTFASRFTGFLRILVIGYVLGVSTLSDAFNYANGIPNIVYDLFLGGILAATLIPVFVEYLADESGPGSRAISAVTTAAMAALAVITAGLWLGAPWVIRFYLLLSPSTTGGEEKILATRLLHWFAPQVFFLGAIVISTALLNARRRFTVAAFSPVVNNAIAIAALLATKFVASHILTLRNSSPSETLDRFSHDNRAVIILGLGTTLGYLAQLLVQLPAMRRARIHLQPIWELRHPAVRRVAALSSWLIGVVIANQLSLALIMVLAGKTNGGVTAYQFSYQFFQLPYALIAVSVAAALMPDLAERWNRRDVAGFERQFVRGLRVTLALLVPIGFAYAAIAQPLIQLALQHGRVTSSGAHLVSTSLALFALGLPGFSAFFLLIRGFQAMQDARTMFWIYALENLATVVLALILDPLIGVPGLALAWVAPYTLACFVAGDRLRRRGISLGGAATMRSIMRVVAAGVIAAAAVYGVGLLFPTRGSDLTLIARLVAQAAVGTIVYVSLAKVLRIRELEPVAAILRQIAGRPPKPQPRHSTAR
jgi:putative peptidoglycan lipid II flippase